VGKNGMIRNNELKQVSLFFIITILLSYFVFWGPLAIFGVPAISFVDDNNGPIWAIILFILGGFVPSVVGIILTGVFEGKKGIKTLLKSAIHFKIGVKWVLIILLVTISYALSLLFIYSLTGGKFDLSQFYMHLPALIPLIILGPISEEFGWRGFATKRLLKNKSANFTSLIIGLVWGLWHLPLFYIVSTSQNNLNLPFLVFLITVISLSFIYTYVFIKTKFSLFSAILLHWLTTYLMEVVSLTVASSRSELYNWLEVIPALILGFIFIVLLSKTNRLEYGEAIQ